MNYGRMMDLHNHTIWSDGNNAPEEIIRNAIKNGIEVVGITDHFQTDKCDSVQSKHLSRYIAMLKELKESYKDQIVVLSGVEICMRRKWSDLGRLPFEELNQLDYVLLEYVQQFNDSVGFHELGKYVEKLQCSKGLAHTDPFALMDQNKLTMQQWIRYLKEYGLFWEVNVNSGYAYFEHVKNNHKDRRVSEFFHLMEQNGIEMTVGSDTHELHFYDLAGIREANDIINAAAVRNCSGSKH